MPKKNAAKPQKVVEFSIEQAEQALQYVNELKKLAEQAGGPVSLDVAELLTLVQQQMQQKKPLKILIKPAGPLFALIVFEPEVEPPKSASISASLISKLKALVTKYEPNYTITLEIAPDLDWYWKYALGQEGFISDLPVCIHLAKKYKKDVIVVNVYDGDKPIAAKKVEYLNSDNIISLQDNINDCKEAYGKFAVFTEKIDPGAMTLLAAWIEKAKAEGTPFELPDTILQAVAQYKQKQAKAKAKAKGKASEKANSPATAPVEPEPPSAVQLYTKLTAWLEQVQNTAYLVDNVQDILKFCMDVKSLADECKQFFPALQPPAQFDDPDLKFLWEGLTMARKKASAFLNATLSSNPYGAKYLQVVAAVMDLYQPEEAKLIIPNVMESSLAYWLNKFYDDLAGEKGPKPPLAKCKQKLAKTEPEKIIHYKTKLYEDVLTHLGEPWAAAVGAHLGVGQTTGTVTLPKLDTPLSSYDPDAALVKVPPKAPPASASATVTPGVASPAASAKPKKVSPIAEPTQPQQIVASLAGVKVLSGQPLYPPLPFATLQEELRAVAALAAEGIRFRQAAKGREYFQKTAIVIDMSFNQAVSAEHEQLTGYHTKFLGHFDDKDSNMPPLLIKYKANGDVEGCLAAAEEAANEIARRVNLPAPEARRVRVKLKNGKYRWCCVQPLIVQLKDRVELSADPKDWTLTWQIAIMQQHVVDMFVGDHDTHSGNYLVVNGIPIRIDRGQAGKFIGEDTISLNYNPSPGIASTNITEPVPNWFYKRVKSGVFSITERDVRNIVFPVIKAIEGIPDEEIRAIWRTTAEIGVKSGEAKWLPRVQNRAKKTKMYPTPEDLVNTFLEMMVERKHKLRANFEKFFSEVFGKPFKF